MFLVIKIINTCFSYGLRTLTHDLCHATCFCPLLKLEFFKAFFKQSEVFRYGFIILFYSVFQNSERVRGLSMF
jgi:hypothetical protein